MVRNLVKEKRNLNKIFTPKLPSLCLAPMRFVVNTRVYLFFCVCIPLLSITTGCSSQSHDDLFHEIALALVDSVQGDPSALRQRQTAEFEEVTAYVDLSESMMGYLKDESSTYRQFVTTLYNRLGNGVEFNGFGRRKGETKQHINTVTASSLLNASSYVRLNNDYSDLFRRLDANEASLIVTDGVQSHNEDGPLYGGIVDAVDSWLQNGGYFAVLLYRSSFNGDYFNEIPSPDSKKELVCTVKDRPFTVFVFLPSPDAMSELLALLGESLQPEHVLAIGDKTMEIEPVETKIRVSDSGRISRGSKVIRSLAKKDKLGLSPYHHSTVIGSSANEDGYLPLQFDITLPIDPKQQLNLTQEEAITILKQLRPSIQTWQLDIPRSLRNLELSSLNIEDLIESKDVKEHLDSRSIQILESDSSQVKARLQVHVQKPNEERENFAWILSLYLSPDGADQMVPDDFSTLVDYKASECDKILNLQPLLGAILRKNYVPGRALLFTKWL